MNKEHIAAGTEVRPGIYKCNACANQHEVRETSEKLPSCSVCDSISWKAARMAREDEAVRKS